MSKYVKTLIVPVLVLVALVVVLVLVAPDDGEDPSSTTTRKPVVMVVQISEEDLSSIHVENDHGVFTLRHDVPDGDDGESKDTWVVEEPAHPAYDATKISSLVSRLRAVSALETVTESAESLAMYGLDDPQVTIRLTDSDGSETVMLLGDLAGSGSNYYASREGSDAVYLVTTATGDTMKQPVTELLSRRLCSVTYDTAKSFTVFRSSDDTSFTVQSKPFYDEDDTFVETHWMFVDPIDWKGKTVQMEELIRAVLDATAKEILTMDGEILPKHGLDDPQYRFEITDEAQSYSITIGADAGSGRLYGISSRLPDVVFTVEASSFTLADAEISRLAEPFIYLADITTVDEVTLTLDGTTTQIRVDTESDPRRYWINGQDADIETRDGKSYFISFYQSLVGGMLSGMDPEAEPDIGDAVAEITYDLKSGETVSIAYVPRDPHSLYAFRDGQYTGVYVDMDVLDEPQPGVNAALPQGIRPALDGIMKAMRLAEDGIFN